MPTSLTDFSYHLSINLVHLYVHISKIHYNIIFPVDSAKKIAKMILAFFCIISFWIKIIVTSANHIKLLKENLGPETV